MKEKNNYKIESNNIIEKALLFATMAHSGQIRKNEKDKPYIIHPMGTARILIEYGADNNVISAGLLHDVVEDTKYTLEDIKNNFGEDIAHLVEVATEKDKSKPWEERRKIKIDETRDLNLREKLLIIADKIDNIENLERVFERQGYRDFSTFKRGEKQQEWYYRNMYESLITNEDKDNPLFKRLEKSINKVFERTMEEYKESIKCEEIKEDER